MEKVYLDLGQRIRERRMRIGLSQAELAERIGQTRASVANLEAGKQRLMLHTVETLAEALEWTPKGLLGW